MSDDKKPSAPSGTPQTAETKIMKTNPRTHKSPILNGVPSRSDYPGDGATGAELSYSGMEAEHLRPLIGLPAWGCWVGHGSALFLEFGEPQPLREQERHPNGQWSLSQMNQTRWRIERRGEWLAGSGDEYAAMEAAIAQLAGKRLLNAELTGPSFDLLLTFEDGIVVRSFADTTEDDPRWNLRPYGGSYTFVGPLPPGVTVRPA